MESRFITPKELASALRTTPAVLANDRYLGRGCPYLKIGGRVLYDSKEVEGWINRHRVKTAD